MKITASMHNANTLLPLKQALWSSKDQSCPFLTVMADGASHSIAFSQVTVRWHGLVISWSTYLDACTLKDVLSAIGRGERHCGMFSYPMLDDYLAKWAEQVHFQGALSVNWQVGNFGLGLYLGRD